MSLRFDLVTGNWVLVAAARRGLPVDSRLAVARVTEGQRPCPFCPGHESETEETLDACYDEHGRWRIRVVGNRFPALSPDAPTSERDRERPARGHQELVIETPEHDVDLADLEPVHRADVLGAYRRRVCALEAKDGIRFVSLFRNKGRRAGSSQPHPHAQLAAVDVVPPAVAHRQRLAREHFATTGCTPLATLVDEARASGERIVVETASFVAFTPFAPHRSYEVWIARREPLAAFTALPDHELQPLADALGDVLRRVRRATGGADYNLVVRTPPVGEAGDPASSCWIEVLPRTGGDAGFELSTEIDVVPTAPEIAAAELRAAP